MSGGLGGLIGGVTGSTSNVGTTSMPGTSMAGLNNNAQSLSSLGSGLIGGAQTILGGSGGLPGTYMTPAQKGAIDAPIQQQIGSNNAAITQNAITSGMGANSASTAEKQQQNVSQLDAQRQTQYSAAQEQNNQLANSEISSAISAITGGNGAYTTEIQTELAQDTAATAASNSMFSSIGSLFGGASGIGSSLGLSGDSGGSDNYTGPSDSGISGIVGGLL